MNKIIGVCNKNSIENLTLEVRESNIYAMELYRKLGFKKGAVRKAYYEDGEDALLMVLDLGVMK
jgi:ribosomal-protein-alanine N-acetyltransferase